MRGRAMRGVSLLETVAAVAVLGVAAAIALAAIGTALPQAAEAQQPVVARELARDLLEEVLSKAFADPDATPEAAGSPRTAFDDVSDYDGYSEKPPRDAVSGAALPSFSDFRRAVEVVPVSTAAPGDAIGVSPAGAKLLRVEVRVDWGTAGSVLLAGLKASTADVLPPPRSGLTYVASSRGAGQGAGQGERLDIVLQNRTGKAIAIDAIELCWEPADPVFFRTIRIDQTVVADRTPLFARCERIPLAFAFASGGSYEWEFGGFRRGSSPSSPSGNADGLTFTLFLHSGATTFRIDIPVRN